MRLSKALFIPAILVSLAPAAARAELMIPVTVRVVGLVQRGDVDPVPPNLGDFFTEVSIDGHTFSNPDDQCENEGTAGFILPHTFFSEGGSVDPSCANVPWTFQADVPFSALQGDDSGTDQKTIPVRIKILDQDTVFDDEVETVDLRVAFGGRWTGDATWPENCVKGGDVEVCWRIDVGQDTDGDGLLDDWEANGLDVDGNGTVDLNLPALGANPMHKDLFVELDWRQGYPPKREEVQKWRAAFLAAPADAGGVLNPDGLPGINLHVDTGALTENGLLVGENLGGGNPLPAQFTACTLEGQNFGLYGAKKTNFNPVRELVFRYGIVATRCCLSGADFGKACTFNVQCTNMDCQESGGRGEIGGNDFVTWNYDQFLGSTLMHELGHTLNLRHGGGVDDNCKPNYLSVMNYDHFELQRLDGSSFLDYSPPRRPNGTRGTAPLRFLAEDDLDETAAVLDPADPNTLMTFTDPNRTKRQTPVGYPVDWNGDGDKGDDDLTVNVDTSSSAGRPALCTNPDIRGELPDPPGPLEGFDDWLHVSLPFIQFGDSADGPLNAVPEVEPTDQEIRQQLQEVNTVDLSVAKSGDPGPYEAGLELTLDYVVDAENEGPNPALPLLVEDTLPAGAAVVSADPACGESAPGTLTCRFDGVLEGETRQVPLSLQVRASCTGGVPTPIVNRARVVNGSPYAGADPDPSNDSASFTTAVVDTTPPELSLSASPSKLWAPDHTLVPITITVRTSDVCDDSPDIRLMSITSNEGTLADGSGHTSPDVQGASFGTDDRSFQLRAERRGPGGGRVYTITYQAQDGSGNVTTSTVTVTVVKSQR